MGAHNTSLCRSFGPKRNQYKIKQGISEEFAPPPLPTRRVSVAMLQQDVQDQVKVLMTFYFDWKPVVFVSCSASFSVASTTLDV